MGQLLFGRTQSALDTPFEPNRNPGYGGVPSQLDSTDVQNAIEEAKNDALSNDRYILLCSYNGNANVGRYLEFFYGIDSSVVPIYLPVATKLLTIVASSSANSTCVIGFYNLTVSSTVSVYDITFTAQKLVTLITVPTAPFYTFPATAQLALKIKSGSVNRPSVYFFLSAAT